MGFVKYCDIERLGTPENESIFANPDDEIVIEEKIDGGNGSFWVEDCVIHFGSRSRDLTAERDEKIFAKQQKALRALLEPQVEKIEQNYIYFVEWCARHTINYQDRLPCVLGLDIKPKEGAFGHTPLFIGRAAKETAFEKLGIKCADLKGVFKAKELTPELYDKLTEKSAYYDGKPEGLVLKNYGRMNVWGHQMFAKIVLAEFKETNRAVFGGIKKDTSDTVKLVGTYCTEARIRKRILALTQEGGQKLDRKLMHLLPVAVVKDIFKEETDAIMKECQDVSIGTMKQMVAKKCLAEIDAMMCEKMKEEGTI